MMDPRRADQPYDIVIDLTGFGVGSQPPVQWLKFITEITPSDLRARKRSIYLLNINDLAHRFLRKIRNLSAGAWEMFSAWFLNADMKNQGGWSSNEKYCSSLAELKELVNPAALGPLTYAGEIVIPPQTLRS